MASAFSWGGYEPPGFTYLVLGWAWGEQGCRSTTHDQGQLNSVQACRGNFNVFSKIENIDTANKRNEKSRRMPTYVGREVHENAQ